MCHCLSFLLAHPTFSQKWVDLAQSLSELCRRLRSWSSQSLSSSEVELLHTTSAWSLDPSSQKLQQRRSIKARRDGCSNGLLAKCGIYVVRKRRSTQEALVTKKNKNVPIPINSNGREQVSEVMKPHEPQLSFDAPLQKKMIHKTTTNGGDGSISLFTRQGLKGINQDSMLVWENFIPSERAIFCGVFDGHGPHGHLVSRHVRDKLPGKLASCWRAIQMSCLMASMHDSSPESNEHASSSKAGGGDPDPISLWEESFHIAFKLMDRELLADKDVDSVSSGTTAVTLVKQGDDLIVANVGDSRAVLGVKLDDSLVPLQLTTDLTPNLPKEAERIRRCKGRVLALRNEPSVKRVWLPHQNTPGLAMARALGDFLLKSYGVISVPEVTHRELSQHDKFVVLATDGVWNVLTNEQVVRIVDTASTRSLAAKAVVDAAVGAWKAKYPDAKVDDCAVVCLFLDSLTKSNSP